MISQEEQKRLVGTKSGEFITDGMTLGLGTGSTAKYAVEAAADTGFELTCVPTSIATKEQAESLGLDVVERGEVVEIDLTIDGADQFDVNTGNCIKGGGGAHYIEKQVAKKSEKLVIIVDESKVVDSLAGYGIPLEVDPHKREEVEQALEDYELVVRDETSDSDNLIVDVKYEGEESVEEFEEFLMGIDGVIDTGFFIGLADVLIVARATGEVEVIEY